MGTSLLWLRDLRLVSGKLGNVELKEILGPTCLATTELSNTNKAHCLFKGERRSVKTEVRFGSCLWISVVCSGLVPLFSGFSRAGLLIQTERQTHDLWKATESHHVS